MTADVFASHMYGLPVAIGERRPVEKSPGQKARHTILLRKLPSSSDREAVRNILLFAKDLVDCELVSHPRHADDKGFACALAHFQTLEGAREARDLLNGKRNATNDATLVVEMIHDGPPGAIGSRRNTVDSTPARSAPPSAAMQAPAANGRQSSRYNGTFQNMEKMSPPNGNPGLGNGEFPVTNLFSPTSPVNTSFTSRNVGKSIINNEADDDDGLLNESIGYATADPRTANLSATPYLFPPWRPTHVTTTTEVAQVTTSPLSPRSSGSPRSPKSPPSARRLFSPTHSPKAVSPKSKPADEEDDFENGIELGRGGILDSHKLTLNKHIILKKPATKGTAPHAARPATTITFTDRPTTSRIPRPLPSIASRTRLTPVYESGAPSNNPTRTMPTTTSAQLLRAKRSAPLLATVL
ncbi:RNA binding protein [Pyrenophora tritici-repentis]|nr:RNA binding protein [Pyrenophora tritici-repentis]